MEWSELFRERWGEDSREKDMSDNHQVNDGKPYVAKDLVSSVKILLSPHQWAC